MVPCHSYNFLFQLLEEDIITFVKDELTTFKKVLSSNNPEFSERPKVMDSKDEEQRRSGRKAFLEITLYFMRRMKQGELADCLQHSKRTSLKI